VTELIAIVYIVIKEVRSRKPRVETRPVVINRRYEADSDEIVEKAVDIYRRIISRPYREYRPLVLDRSSSAEI
jgi:hypothetical protein